MRHRSDIITDNEACGLQAGVLGVIEIKYYYQNESQNRSTSFCCIHVIIMALTWSICMYIPHKDEKVHCIIMSSDHNAIISDLYTA